MSQNAHSPSRVLVVDDNEAARYAVSTHLRRAGHEIVEAATGTACLEHVRNHPPDLIVLDVKLPDVSGTAICQQLKADPATASIPVIQISAMFTATHDRIAGLESGADSYLAVPFEPRELVAQVNALLRLGRAEAALRKSEERLRLATAAAGMFCWEIDLATFMIQRSETAAVVLGCPESELPAQLVDRPFYAAPDEVPRLWEEFRACLDRHADECSFAFRGRDEGPNTRYWEAKARLLYDPAGKPVRLIGVTQDVTTRRRVEIALQLSEEQLRLSLDASNAGTWCFDGVTNTPTWDERFSEQLGLEPGTPCSMETWSARVPRQDRERLAQRVDAMLATPADDLWNEEIRIDHPTKGLRWMLSLGRVTARDFTGRGLRICGIHLDITERKQVQERLRESEQRYRSLFEKNPFPMWVFDLETLRFLAVNNAAVTHYGYSHDEFAAMTIEDIRPPEDLPKFRHIIETIASTPISHQGGWRHCKKDRSIIDVEITSHPVDFSGRPARLVLACDITERKRAEEALRESEARFRTMADGLPLIVWVHGPDGQQQFVNRTFCEFFGGPREQMRGERWQSLMHPDDAPAYAREFLACIGDHRPFHAEVRVKNRDGQWRWIESWANPRFSASGEFLGMVGTSADVTLHKEFESELERLVTERTAKLHELVGELEHFSYSITHDMRAPLRAMRGFAEVIKEMMADSAQPELKTFLRQIITSAERMDLLITDALSYSRALRQELPLAPVDLAELLRNMLDTYPEFLVNHASIHVEGKLPAVLGNQAGLTQCFSNLIGNALKFVEPGKEPAVRIYAELMEDPRPPGNGSSRSAPGRWVRVCVADHGIGIPEYMLPRLFNMFVRGTGNYDGTGIGLALVRKVVQRMGGRVGVDSAPGQGSRFWLELPAAEPDPQP